MYMNMELQVVSLLQKENFSGNPCSHITECSLLYLCLFLFRLKSIKAELKKSEQKAKKKQEDRLKREAENRCKTRKIGKMK